MSFAHAAAFPFLLARDPGVSDAAKGLERDVLKAFFGHGADELQRRLIQAVADVRVPVSVETFERARRFAWMVPARTPVPDVLVEEDGEIVFDWQEARDRVLSVVVKKTPFLGYAALIGAEPLYGRVPFTGTLPETVLHVLARLYPAHPVASRTRRAD